MRVIIAVALISLSSCASIHDPEVYADVVELIDDITRDEQQ